MIGLVIVQACDSRGFPVVRCMLHHERAVMDGHTRKQWTDDEEDEDVAPYQDLYYALRRLCLLHMYTQHRHHIYTHPRQ